DDRRGEGRAEGLGQPAGFDERQRVDSREREGTDHGRDQQGGEEFAAPAGEQTDVGHASVSGWRAVTARPVTWTATPMPGPARSAIAARTSSGPGTATRRAAAATTATHHPAL